MTKPTTSETTVTIVFPWEAAFDHEATDDAGNNACEAYANCAAEDPGAWRRMLKLLPGKTPTEFEIGPLTASEVARLEDDCFAYADEEGRKVRRLAKQSELFLRTFKLSLRGIVGRDPPKTPKGRIEDAYLERNFAGGTNKHVAQFVGMVAWAWNQFTETDAKNS